MVEGIVVYYVLGTGDRGYFGLLCFYVQMVEGIVVYYVFMYRWSRVLWFTMFLCTGGWGYFGLLCFYVQVVGGILVYYVLCTDG